MAAFREATGPCARTWEVEAARDGRLSGRALEAITDHAGHCPDCGARAAYLTRLGLELRASCAESEGDATRVRRLRGRLLAAVDATLAGRTPGRFTFRRGRLTFALGGAVTGVVSTLVFVWMTKAPPNLRPETFVGVSEEGHSVWSRRTAGDIERLDLKEGALRIEVRSPPGGNRVSLKVPDGEIRDQGTVFHVAVHSGKTRRIQVESGRVLASLKDTPPFVIFAGQSWEAEDRAPGGAPASDPTDYSPASDSATSIHSAERGLAPKPSARAIGSQASKSGSESAPGVAATRKRPSEPSAAEAEQAEEDAAYLRVVKLLRDGQRVQAKDAALAYLYKFPRGFRRDEVRRIAE